MTSSRQPTPSALSTGRLAPLQLVSGSVLMGTIGAFAHFAGQPAFATTWWRCAVGVVLLIAWLGMRRRLAMLRLPRRAWPAAVGCAALTVAAWSLFFAAIPRLSLSVATVGFQLHTVWVLTLAAAWLGERSAPAAWAAAALAMVGVGLATGATADLGAPDALGIAMCLAGSVCTAGVTLIARAGGVAPVPLACWQCGLGALMLSWAPIAQPMPVPETWAWLLGLGAVPTALAYALLFSGTQSATAARSAVAQLAYPITAVLIDTTVFKTVLSPSQWLGLSLLGIAIVLPTAAAWPSGKDARNPA